MQSSLLQKCYSIIWLTLYFDIYFKKSKDSSYTYHNPDMSFLFLKFSLCLELNSLCEILFFNIFWQIPCVFPVWKNEHQNS